MSSDGVVAGVGVRGADRVHAVAPCAGTLEDHHVHPVGLAAQPREGDDLEVADAGRHLLGNRLHERFHHRVGELVAGGEDGNLKPSEVPSMGRVPDLNLDGLR